MSLKPCKVTKKTAVPFVFLFLLVAYYEIRLFWQRDCVLVFLFILCVIETKPHFPNLFDALY